MYYNNNYDRRVLFASRDFHEYQTGLIDHLRKQVERLNIDELKGEEKKKSMIEDATCTVPTIDWAKIEMIKKEEKTRQDDDEVWGSGTYKETVCTFEAPFTGDWSLFSISPTQRRLSHDEADVNHNNTLTFQLTAKENPEQNKADLKRVQDNIDFNLNHLRNDIAGYNANLEQVINNLFERRVAELEEHSSKADSFGVPVRGAE